jgi:hypothetical protein
MIPREHVHAVSFLRVTDRARVPLPRAVRNARTVIERVTEHARKVQAEHADEQTDTVIERMAGEIVAVAAEGDVPTPDVFAAVDTVERKRRASELSLEVARRAVDRSWSALRVALGQHHDALIASLRKTLDETLGEVRAIADDLRGVNIPHPETFAGNPAAGKAYQRLAEAATRYVDLREAQRQLWGGEPPDDELFLIENVADVWQGAGVGWRGHHQVKRKPWPVPVNSFAYVLWIATGIGGEGKVAPVAWIPTREE